MELKNTKENRAIRDVAASMALENMLISKSFLNEMIMVSNGEKKMEDLRRETIAKYAG